MTQAELDKELDAIIKDCDYKAMPLLCKKAHSGVNGAKWVRNRCYHLILKEGLGLEESLTQIESELGEIV